MNNSGARYSNFLLVLSMVTAMIFWGISWPASKILVQYTSADIVTFWRFFFAFLASIPVVICLRINLKLDNSSFKLLIVTSMLNGLYSILYFFGLNFGSAGKGGVLVTTLTPVFAYLIFFTVKSKDRVPKNNEIIGLFLGICAGICLLDVSNSNLLNMFNVLFIACAIDWAILSTVCQRIKINPIAINFYNSMFSAILYIPIIAFNNDAFDILSYDINFWSMMFVVSVLSTTVGTSIYYIGISRVGATKASTYPLLVPFVALVGSYFILNEIPSILTIIGGIMSVFAIYLINLYKPNHLHFFGLYKK